MTAEQLRRSRPRRPFVAVSAMAFAALVLGSWAAPELRDGGFGTSGGANLGRFLQEIRPHTSAAGGLGPWLADLFDATTLAAVADTVALAITSIALASALGFVGGLLAARTLTTPQPYLQGARAPSWPQRAALTTLRTASRALLVITRALPEYLWAFLLVLLLGLGPWPALIALALHNAGILGRLWAELVEDVEPAAARTLRALGASRGQIALSALWPTLRGRYALYVLTRWESAIRESTVIGLLGIVSLGWLIRDARARTHYDEMMVYVVLGALLVIVGDALSAVLRARLRTS
ncbi:MAG: ABC transporter permease subunit [Myxococcales bacterium]|nr:ABC transporter permease subunit [Myxococcales bacterium]